MKSFRRCRHSPEHPPALRWVAGCHGSSSTSSILPPPTLQSGKLTWTTPQPTPPCPIYKSLTSAPAAMELKVDTVRRRRRCRRPGERRRRNSCSVVSRAVVCARAHTTATKRLSFRRFRNDSTNKATKERKKRN